MARAQVQFKFVEGGVDERSPAAVARVQVPAGASAKRGRKREEGDRGWFRGRKEYGKEKGTKERRNKRKEHQGRRKSKELNGEEKESFILISAFSICRL